MTMKRSAARKPRRANRVPIVVTIAVLAVIVIAGAIGLIASRHRGTPVENLPVLYEDVIRACAEENGLEPAYPAAVIMAESSYRPEAVSSANAIGLMQLLPETGEWVSGKLGETYVDGCLFDPETNIRYGCWYLGWLMRRYDGDKTCASSAYHQGQGTVDKWLSNAAYSADGRTLNVIPSEATDTYVKRVLRYYERYVELYAAQQP